MSDRRTFIFIVIVFLMSCGLLMLADRLDRRARMLEIEEKWTPGN